MLLSACATTEPDASTAGVFECEIRPLQPDEFGKAVAGYAITGTTVSNYSGGLPGKAMVVHQGKGRVACGSTE